MSALAALLRQCERGLALFVGLALLVCAGSCAEQLSATEVVVLIDSDLQVGTELTSLQVSVYEAEGSELLNSRPLQLGVEPLGNAQFELPLSFSLLEDEFGSGPFRLVVTGKLGAQEVVEQQVVTSFRSNTALLLTVFLARSCAAQLCREAGADQTCDPRTGQCMPVPTSSQLPEVEGTGLEDYLRPVFGADADAAVPFDAGPVLDANMNVGLDARTAAQGGIDAGMQTLPSDAGTQSGDASSPGTGDAAADAGPARDANADANADANVDATTEAGTGPVDAGPTGPTPVLPAVVGTCPTLATGTLNLLGASVRLWVGTKRGPLHVYWHGTGTNAQEINQMLPGATTAVASEGGMVASFESSNGQGKTTGTIWFTGDFQVVDQLVACGAAQGWVDARRIHVSGYSAGGMQAGALAFERSSYVASAFTFSGGLYEDIDAGVSYGLEDASNVPSFGLIHGAKGSDALASVDFSDLGRRTATRIRTLGGFAFECDDGGSHIGLNRGTAVGAAVLQFFKDHPFKTKPSPYAGALPSGWPSYCAVTR